MAFLDFQGHIISVSFHACRNVKRDELTVRPLGWEAVVWPLRQFQKGVVGQNGGTQESDDGQDDLWPQD